MNRTQRRARRKYKEWLKTHPRTPRFRVKQRTIWQMRFVNTSGISWKIALQWRAIGGFPRDYGNPRVDRIEYTYDGLKTTFNTCNAYSNDLQGMIPPGVVSTTSNETIGWKDVAEMRVMDPYLLRNPPGYELFFTPQHVHRTWDRGGVDGAAFDAYQSVRTAVPHTYMNVMRAVAELKDTKQTLKGFESFFKWASSVGRGRITPLMSCLEVASAYLTWQFGVAPTVSEAKKFCSELSSEKLRFRVEPLVIEKDQIFRAAYKIKPTNEELTALCGVKPQAEVKYQPWLGTNGVFTYLDTSSYTRPWIPDEWWYHLSRVWSTESRGVVFARASKSYQSSSMKQGFNEFRWNCPIVKTMWDLYPFSFLVDWFVDIGTTIRRLEHQTEHEEVQALFKEIWHSAESALVERAPRISCESNVLDCVRVHPDYRMWSVPIRNRAFISSWEVCSTQKVYHRTPYVPPIAPLLPTFRWKLSAYQLSAGAALITTLAGSLAKAYGIKLK